MTRHALPVVDGPLEVTLDGEALRVIGPPGFTDIDDDIPEKGMR